MKTTSGLTFTLVLALMSDAAMAQDSFGDTAVSPSRGAQPTLSNEAPAPAPPPPRIGQPSREAPSNYAPIAKMEQQDFGVAATDQLHGGAMHGPTPTQIPGGAVIGTESLHSQLQQSQPILLFDVLGGAEGLPGAQNALGAAQAGSFSDRVQADFGQYLGQVTGGNKGAPMVFYCLSVQCWMSYNAALRAIHLGYTKVHWYRGGFEAWQAAGLPTYPRM